MKQRYFNAYQLKWLALLTMAVDHFGVLVLLPYTQNNTISFLYLLARLIGRLAFPLFAFMIAEGIYRTRNPIHYWLRLLSMAIVIGVAMWVLSLLGITTLSGNIFVDLSMAALAMLFFKQPSLWKKIFAILPILYVVITSLSPIIPNFLKADYGIYGLVMMLVFYLAYTPFINIQFFSRALQVEDPNLSPGVNRYKIAAISLIFMHIIWWLMSVILGDVIGIINGFTQYLNRFVGVQTYAVIAGYFIYRYQGEKGNPPSWFKTFSYLFYPLHFVALYLLYYLTTL